MQVLRTAKSWGKRPTELLGVHFARGWGLTDTQLALALDVYQQTRVGAYGFPKRLTEGDYEGWFEVELTQDNAQLAFDQWRRENKEELPPGTVPRVIFTGQEE